MKLMKLGSLLVVCIGITAVAGYWAEDVFAQGHGCCGNASAGSPSKSEPADEKAATPPSTAKSKSTATGDAAAIEKQKPAYPLDTCVVLGNKLGEHGDVVDYVYKGRLVRFCCKGCIATFEKDPAKYLAKLDEAVKGKEKAKEKGKEKAKTGTNSPKSTGEASPGSHAGHFGH